MSEKITFAELKSHLFTAADILRKHLNASENFKPVLSLLFLKRLNDVFEENAEKLIKNDGISKQEAYGNKKRHDFFIPEEARWNVLEKASEDIGAKFIKICKKIESENEEKLGGTMTYAEFNIKEKYPDNALQKLISHFGSKRLRTSDLESEDIFGDAYEQLLEMFADETKKKGGQFYTPREVVRLLVKITEPHYDHRICDPTCGSGGMLIHSRRFAEEELQKQKKSDKEIAKLMKNLTLHGQDSNIDTVNMCKMNMVLHGVTDFNIEWGDVLESPKFTQGGKLIEYDRVLANFPFSENWNNEGAEKDPYKRFRYGIPPAKDKADFAFILHMLSILNKTGQAGIVCSQGVLFRGGVEQRIREKMILGDAKENLPGDVIEAVIALPQALFFGTGIPGCILILNKNKLEKRKNKILFIYGAKEYQEGKVRNKLRDKDIEHMVSAFEKFEDEDKYCHVSDLEELKENEYNLNVPRYVDISEPEEEVDIQATIDELKKLDKEKEELELKVKADLKELGFKI